MKDNAVSDPCELHPCEKEKLPWSGQIQPFGALIGVDKTTLSVTHASANTAEVLGRAPETLFGLSVEALSSQLAVILEEMAFEPADQVFERQVALGAHPCWLRISQDVRHYVIDIQSYDKSVQVAGASPELTQKLAYSPDTEEGAQSLFETLVTLVRQLTDYDRVMLYQFQPDWSGQVMAETKKTGLGSYLDLRFPASDIPKIARDLYVKNASRTICDARMDPVPILSATQQPIDLTYSDTRSVSPVHLQYLQNMGVSASFSLPIVIHQSLWGLVACHHYTPKHLLPQVKKQAVTQVDRFRRALHGYLAKRKMQHYDQREAVLKRLASRLQRLTERQNLLEESSAEVLDLLQAQGFVWIDDETCLTTGQVPEASVLDRLDQWFMERADSDVFVTDSLMRDDIPGREAEGLAGLLAVRVWKQHQWQRCYWFKEEVVRDLVWAGNPDKPIMENADVSSLSPRRSFDQWVETRRHHSAQFEDFDCLTARRFVHVLSDQLGTK
ncbi:MAG: GAF domain-containing protein [Hydrogenovibrio sp.]|uniref:GAF domain-containing protein n=1 Tax=Hydrogenovibrio sp. TaxID=2065821 RepID=UPI00287086EA|nr:GAF domain-containing protein [Hydrogenovibrio sp.]MDR9498031.1 GAF domain-containing protein [Hydrogenovibrio sp.]